jgi:outer membrane protein assembly factor BamB
VYGNDTDLAFSSAPLAQDGVLYAATLQHELVALSLSDGTARWRRPLTFNGVFEAPVLAGGLLLVVEEQSSNQAPVLASRLDAFDAATGELRWSRAGGSDYLHLLAPRVRDGVVYSALDGALSALRLRDGATLWRADLPHRTNGRAAVDEKGQVYLTWQNARAPDASSVFSTGYVAALRATDGAVVWRSEAIEDVVPAGESPQVAEGLVYGVTRGRAFVLDATTGRQLWRYPEALPNLFLGVRGAALAGGVIYLSLNNGAYVALDASTGAERWRIASLFDVDLGVGVTRSLGPPAPRCGGPALLRVRREWYWRSRTRGDGRTRHAHGRVALAYSSQGGPSIPPSASRHIRDGY